MATTKQNLTVFPELTVLAISGYKGEPRFDGDEEPPGSLFYLVGQYGMRYSFKGEPGPGVLYTDADFGNLVYRFSVLIQPNEVGPLGRLARDLRYTVHDPIPVDEPMRYGDGSGTVEIVRHRDGWLILE